MHVLEVLDDDLGVEFGRHPCNVRSYFAHQPRSLLDRGFSPILALPSDNLRVREFLW